MKTESKDASFITLKKGEILKHGDEYCDPHNGKWFPTKSVGHRSGLPHRTGLRYRRPVVRQD